MVRTVKGLDRTLQSMKTIARAYLEVRSGKETHPDIVEIDRDPMTFLKGVQYDIIHQTYEPGPYIEFDKFERGKLRHVAYQSIRDQVFQWVWKLTVEPEINKRLIGHTYASIKGRGQHDAVHKAQEFMRKDPEGTMYCLDFDVQQCFKSITAEVVMRKMRRKFADPGVLWLTEKILMGYHNGRELPLGNVTSHPLANFVLDDVDRVITDAGVLNKTGERGMNADRYIRYLDNGYVWARSTAYLRRVKKRIVEKFRELGLTMKPNWQIYKVDSRGTAILGYRVFHKFTLLCKKTKIKMKRLLGDAIAHIGRARIRHRRNSDNSAHTRECWIIAAPGDYQRRRQGYSREYGRRRHGSDYRSIRHVPPRARKRTDRNPVQVRRHIHDRRG